MRKIEIYAKEKYNGNIKAALVDMVNGNSERGLEEFADELTQVESLFVVRQGIVVASAKVGGISNFKKVVKKEQFLRELDISEQEILTAEKNPYKTKTLKGALLALIMGGGILALSLSGVPLDNFSLGVSVATGILASTLAPNLINYVKFKKAKKMAEEQDVLFFNNGNGRGRS